MDSDSAKLIWFSAAALGGGFIAFFWGLREYWRERLMKNTPLSKIDSVALGLAELQGHAVPLTTMLSPIEQQPCVYWHCKVEELRSAGKSSYWATIEEDKSQTPFYIEDDTGKILVDPEGADVDIPQDLYEETGVFHRLSPCCVAFAERSDIEVDGFFTSQKRFTEWMIEPQDQLFVFGTVTAPEGQLAGVTKTEDRIVCRDPRQKFFLISDKSARAVERKFAWKAFAGIFGGGLLMIIGLSLLARFD